MKKTKRLLAILFSVLMVLTLFPAAALADMGVVVTDFEIPASGTFIDSSGMHWRVLRNDGNGNSLIIADRVRDAGTPVINRWATLNEMMRTHLLENWTLAPEIAALALLPVGADTDVRTELTSGSFLNLPSNENGAAGITTPGAQATTPNEGLFIFSISEANEYFGNNASRAANSASAPHVPTGWYLRSPGVTFPTGIDEIVIVGITGSVSTLNPGGAVVAGVRPALWVGAGEGPGCGTTGCTCDPCECDPNNGCGEGPGCGTTGCTCDPCECDPNNGCGEGPGCGTTGCTCDPCECDPNNGCGEGPGCGTTGCTCDPCECEPNNGCGEGPGCGTTGCTCDPCECEPNNGCGEGPGCGTTGCTCDPCECDPNNGCGEGPGCGTTGCTCDPCECDPNNGCGEGPGCDCGNTNCCDNEPGDCTCDDCDCQETGDPRERHLAYMFGDDHGNFLPSGNITRAQVAAILVRTQLVDFEQNLRRLPDGMTSFEVFSDVGPNNWFFFYVAWAYDADLVQGYRGSFRPNEPVTRQELAAMIARLGDVREAGNAGFPDAGDASAWAVKYVYTVYREGLMQGDQNGRFQPQRNITRAETATVMNRILERIDSREAFAAIEEVVDLDNQRPFPDLRATAWYFPSVLAAANDHYLTRDEDGVIDWKQILPAAE